MKKKDKILNIENYLFVKYSFRFNLLAKELEWSDTNNVYRKLTDNTYRKMIRECIDANIDANQTLLDLALSSSKIKQFDPINSYFEKLPDYDGVTDYIEQLANSIKAKDQLRFHAYLKLWLVGWVAGMLQDKIVNHHALILQGNQGVGKTTWIQNLVPMSLREYYFSGTINPKNKDTAILQANCVLINLDELDNLNKKESNNLKHLLTNNTISCRLPYDRRISTLNRVTSYAGSINDVQFLRDTTGSRRFFVAKVSKIELHSNVNIDNVIFQAFFLFKNGFKYWIDDQDIITEIQDYNERFRIITLAEELVEHNFSKPNGNERFMYMNATEIFVRLRQPNGVSVVMIVKAMKKLGFERRKILGYYRYKVCFIGKEQGPSDFITVDPSSSIMNLIQPDNEKTPKWIFNVLNSFELGKKVS